MGRIREGGRGESASLISLYTHVVSIHTAKALTAAFSPALTIVSSIFRHEAIATGSPFRVVPWLPMRDDPDDRSNELGTEVAIGETAMKNAENHMG